MAPKRVAAANKPVVPTLVPRAAHRNVGKRIMLILKIIILASLIKLLIATNNPLLCTSVYVSFGFIFGLLLGNPFVYVLIAAAISFGLAFAYFWLLNRFEDSGMFWVILVVGLLIGIV